MVYASFSHAKAGRGLKHLNGESVKGKWVQLPQKRNWGTEGMFLRFPVTLKISGSGTAPQKLAP